MCSSTERDENARALLQRTLMLGVRLWSCFSSRVKRWLFTSKISTLCSEGAVTAIPPAARA